MNIEMKNVSKTFWKNTKALKNINIVFKENQITGLIGFNGSGKTTSFNILSNFIEKYKGSLSIGKMPITQEIRKTISYLSAGAEPKNPARVLSHLYNIASLYKLSKRNAKEIIYDLAEKMEFTDNLKKSIKSLSKGNQQKIKVITSLLNPKMKILFLDEPFDGLDPIMVKKISKIFMGLKDITIIITSHRMDVVQEMCEEFYVLKDGDCIAQKRTDDKTIIISANLEIPVKTTLKDMKCIKRIIKVNAEWRIEVSGMEHFKIVNKKLIASTKYKWSSLKSKNIAEAVFEGYGV